MKNRLVSITFYKVEDGIFPPEEVEVFDENFERCFYKYGKFHYFKDTWRSSGKQPKAWGKIPVIDLEDLWDIIQVLII